jgi:AraC-like DNA-binding protein
VSATEVVTITLTTMSFSVALFGALGVLADPAQRKVGWGLVLFLCVAAFDNLAATVGLWGYVPQLIWIGALEPLVTFLYGPAIYLYVMTVTGRSVSRRRIILCFGLPLVFASVLVGVMLRLPHEVQVAMLEGTAMDGPGIGPRIGLLILLAQSSFILVTLAFLVATWRALDDNLRRLGALFSSIEDRTLSWLRVVMILISVAWAWAAMLGLLGTIGLNSIWLEAVDGTITLGWVSTLAFFGLRQRPVLQDGLITVEVLPEVTGKYARSALDDERMRKLGGRMTQLMRNQALHRDPALSLRLLADKVGASPNYVSQTLNDHLGVSFFDFVNGFRVDDAERLLRETDRNVTDIALEVGFNSRSTFNAAVRKHRGKSPTEMRRLG